MTLPRRPTFASVILLIGAPTFACAGLGFAAEREISLTECVQLALRQNLDLISGKYDPLIAKFELDEARSVYQPEISADLSHQNTKSGRGQIDETASMEDRYSAGLEGLLPSGAQYTLGFSQSRGDGLNTNGRFLEEDGFLGLRVSQPLLKNAWIDQARLGISVGRLNQRLSEHELRSLLMTVVTEVELAYYALVEARDRLSIIEESNALASKLVEAHSRRVAVGRLARQDVRQAQARVAASEAALHAARNQVSARETDLKLLITRDFAGWADARIVPQSELSQTQITTSKGESWRRALTQRPDLAQARIALEEAQIRLRFEENQRYPSLDLVGSYGLAGDTGTIRRRSAPDYLVGIQLRFPLGNGEARARARIQEARKRQALLAYKQLEQQIMGDVATAIDAVESSWQRMDSTHEARAFAESALQAEETKLSNGKSTNFIVLQLQAELTQARLSETIATVDYNRALALLALQEASTLQRHQIPFEDITAIEKSDSDHTRRRRP